jgi:hypothetical protein
MAVQDDSPPLRQTEDDSPPPPPPHGERLLQQAVTGLLHSEGVHDLLSTLVRGGGGDVSGDVNNNNPQGPQGGTALLGAISNLMHTLRPSSDSGARRPDSGQADSP